MADRKSYVRLLWSQNVDFACLSAVASTKKFTIAGDKRRHFIVGTPFTKTGTGSGSFVVDAVTYDGTNTIITVSESVTDSTNNGLLRLAYNFLEWTNGGGSWAWCYPSWSNPRAREVDRYGNVHILVPPGTASHYYQQQGYATAAHIMVAGQMALALAADGTGFPQIAYERLVGVGDGKGSTLFYILHEETLLLNGSDWTRRLCYQGYCSNPSEILGSLRTAEKRNNWDLAFDITGDGTFSALGDLAGASWRSKP